MKSIKDLLSKQTGYWIHVWHGLYTNMQDQTFEASLWESQWEGLHWKLGGPYWVALCLIKEWNGMERLDGGERGAHEKQAMVSKQSQILGLHNI